jgi:hypothetical protein
MNLSPRTKFVLMFILFAMPITASYLTYFFWTPDTTNNFGTLIRPVVTLPPTNLKVVGGSDFPEGMRAQSLRGRWLVVTRDSGVCENECAQKLYAMRQVRLLAGKDLDRVARVLLIDDATPFASTRAREFEGTAWVEAAPEAWLSLLPRPAGDAAPRDWLYLVDPMGNIFMRYPANEDIKRISADLKRVLKASQLGKEMEGRPLPSPASNAGANS